MKNLLKNSMGLIFLCFNLGMIHLLKMGGLFTKFFEIELFDAETYYLSIIALMWCLIIGGMVFFKPIGVFLTRYSPTQRANVVETFLVITLCHFCSLVIFGLLLGPSTFSWIVAAVSVFFISCMVGFAAATAFHFLVFGTVFVDEPSDVEVEEINRITASAQSTYFWRNRLAYVVPPVVFVALQYSTVGIMVAFSERFYQANYFTITRFGWSMNEVIMLIFVGAFLNLFGRPVAHFVMRESIPYWFKETVGYSLGFTVIILLALTYSQSLENQYGFGTVPENALILAVLIFLIEVWIASAAFGWIRREDTATSKTVVVANTVSP